MRLFLDASISPAVGECLKQLGFEVLAQREALALNSPDETVLQEAWARDCAIVARDYDMAELVLRGFARAKAVVIVAFDLPSAADEAKRIADELRILGDRLHGAVHVLEPARIRSRPIVLSD